VRSDTPDNGPWRVSLRPESCETFCVMEPRKRAYSFTTRKSRDYSVRALTPAAQNVSPHGAL
jgi:hypothetical protein